MKAQENEVNRNIDPETAEGHRIAQRAPRVVSETGKRAFTAPADGLDDEAEGHRIAQR